MLTGALQRLRLLRQWTLCDLVLLKSMPCLGVSIVRFLLGPIIATSGYTATAANSGDL